MNTLQNVFNQMAGYLRSIGGNPWGTFDQRGWGFNGPNGEKCALQGICKTKINDLYQALYELDLPATDKNVHFCEAVIRLFDFGLNQNNFEELLVYLANKFNLSYFETIPDKQITTETKEKEVEIV